MGVLKRMFGTVDRAHDVVTGVAGFERAAALARSGDPGTAVITGIDRRWKNEVANTVLRLEWYSPEPRVGAARYLGELPLVIRLGSTVRIRTDGDAVVVDAAAMAQAPCPPDDLGRSHGSDPDQGLTDKALDTRVLSRLKKWPAETGVVESFERISLLGRATDNWDIVVRRADGSRTTIGRDVVPPYARWYVRPEAELPIVVDPKNAGRAQANWPLLAEQRAVSGGTWQDEPPVGSMAADQRDRG